ncbi:MAG: hypothetical protein IPK12_12740 [Gemmatimonadetes bacterium]|nr:hypothetical protein [Gemmatimonadota bacterium]
MSLSPVVLQALLLAATLAALLSPSRRGLAGVLVLALAFAGLLVAGGPDWALGQLAPRNAGISAGLVLYGVALLVAGALLGSSRATRRGPGLALLALGAAAALVPVVPLVQQGGAGVTVAALAGFTVATFVLGVFGPFLRIGAAVRWLETQAGTAPAVPESPGVLSAGALLAVGAVLVPGAHGLLACAVATVLLGLYGWLNAGSTRGAGPLVSGGLALGLLLFAWWYLARVAGDTSLRLADLAEGPFSPAFELSASVPLALAAWVLLGLAPFHRGRLGSWAPVVGGALLVRLTAVALPSGLVHWQPLLYLPGTLAAWHAVATRRVDEGVVALAALGLASAAPQPGWAGLGLAALPGLVALAGLTRARQPALAEVVTGVACAAGAALLVPAVSGGLATEAFYTVLTVLGAAALAWLAGGDAPTGVSARAE